jgi:hypothetical protein
MDPLILEQTRYTPEVRFDASAPSLIMRGESYPENAAAFFTPVLRWLETHLTEGDSPVVLDLTITYFNSSSSKALLDIMDILDQAAAKGRQVSINWHYHEENDMALEYGEDFQEDMAHVTLNLLAFQD